MSNVATTKMSSKGQVVIPENIRQKLKLKTGSKFVVVGEKDMIIFKSISPPSLNQFEELITEVKIQAKKTSIRPYDIKAVINKVRSKR